MRQLFLDVETIKTFDDVGGYFPEKLGVSFAGLIERENNQEIRYELFEKDLSKIPFLLERADLIIGFNHVGFDLPALSAYYHGNMSKLPVLDILEVIKDRAGHRVSLNALARETLGTKKLGSGLDAIYYYQHREFVKLAQYCMKDVEITRDIYDYGVKNGKVKFLNKWNNVMELGVDFSVKSLGEGLQMTLI